MMTSIISIVNWRQLQYNYSRVIDGSGCASSKDRGHGTRNLTTGSSLFQAHSEESLELFSKLASPQDVSGLLSVRERLKFEIQTKTRVYLETQEI